MSTLPTQHNLADPERTRGFLAHYSRASNWIFAYLLSLVRNKADADELFQETSALLWERYDEFEPGTEFRAWACRVAYYKVLDWRKKSRRTPALLGENYLEAVHNAQLRSAERGGDAGDALAECLSQLEPTQRELIHQRYTHAASVQDIAERTGRSIHAVYRSLKAIHEMLLRCIQKNSQGGGA